MARKRMYRRGKTIKSVVALNKAIVAGRWIYLRDVPKHPTIFDGMTLRTLRNMVRSGVLAFAERNDP